MINGNNMYIQTAGMNIRKDNDDWRKAMDTVEVSNTYTAQDEGKVVSDGVLVAQTAMPEEVTENGTINTTLYNSVTVNVSGGGAGGTDVIFYDYDGTIVASYSAADFAQLTELPANPTHTGLTAQGWNWSLEAAQSYVEDYGKLNIGQMYITDDSRTRIYITLTEGRTSPTLQLYLDYESVIDVDWGDNSVHSTFIGSADYISEKHEYATTGDYVISISVVEGGLILQSSSEDLSSILWDAQDSAYSLDTPYNNAMKKVEIGSGVSAIDSYAFYKCYALASVTIPSGVESIDNFAFSMCNSLTSIVIPNTVDTVGDNAFYACGTLRIVSLPEDLTTIGVGAFGSCQALTTLTIPNTVQTIGSGTFDGCTALIDIKLPDSLTTIENNTFRSCTALTSITLPSELVTIGTYAFNGCYSLSDITLPDTITSIGERNFTNDRALTTITIPEGVTSLGAGMFYTCDALLYVTLPSTLVSIGRETFYRCYSLSSITIPINVTSIGDMAFYACVTLNYIKFEPMTPPTVANYTTWNNVPTSAEILVPLGKYGAYTSASKYPLTTNYTYLVYNTYAYGESLPTTSTDGYTLTWYATMNDASSQTNPITVGNGNEVYARCS